MIKKNKKKITDELQEASKVPLKQVFNNNKIVAQGGAPRQDRQ